jgi:hypothetical protein
VSTHALPLRLRSRVIGALDDAFVAFRSYTRARHLRLSEPATRIVSGDFGTAGIPVPATVSPEDRRG